MHVGPFEFKDFYASLKDASTISEKECNSFQKKFYTGGSANMNDWLQE